MDRFLKQIIMFSICSVGGCRNVPIVRNDFESLCFLGTMFSSDANNPIWFEIPWWLLLMSKQSCFDLRFESNPTAIFIFKGSILENIKHKTSGEKRHDRANDKGNFNWMNTLLTIIKGSVFSQYNPSYGAHCLPSQNERSKKRNLFLVPFVASRSE